MKNSTYWTINFILVLVCLFFFMNIPHPGGENSEFLCGIIALFLFSTISSILTIPKSPRHNNWEDFSSAIIQKRTLIFSLESIALTVILVSFSTLDHLLLPSCLILAIAIILAYYSLPFLLSHFYQNRIVLLILSVVIFFFQYFLFLNYMPQSNHEVVISFPGLIQAIALGIHLVLIFYFFSLLGKPASRRMLWKEAREILPSFGIVILIFTILRLIPHDQGITIFLSFILVFLYGAFLGAKAFSGEKTHNTYNYLLTCPLKSNTILLNKYFSGLGFILLLIGFAFLSIGNIPLELITTLIFPLLLMGVIYSFSFLVSIFLQDTFRSTLFRLVACFLSGTISFLVYYLRATHFPQIDNSHRMVVYIVSETILIFLFCVIILGIIGIGFSSYRRKQFHWRNGFSGIIIVSLFLIYAGDRTIFGNLTPLNSSFLPVSSNDNIHVWKNTIYRSINTESGRYPNKFTIQAVDYSNPSKPDSINEIKTLNRAYIVQFHQGKLYSLESCNQGCELVSYDLPDKNHSYSQLTSKRIPLNIQKPFMSRIYINNNQLIFSYSKITGYSLSIKTTENIPQCKFLES